MNTDFDLSDFDWPEFHSRYPGLTFDSESSLFPSTFDNSHHLLTCDEVNRSLPRHKAHRFPAEIFSEIFLYTVQADPRSRTELMLVCRHWYDIMLSTPGIHSQLRIYHWTQNGDVERFGKRWLLDVIVDPDHVPVDTDPMDRYWLRTSYDFVQFQATFMAAAEAASRWRSLALLSFRHAEKCKDLQIMHPLQQLESFKLAANCELGNFLEPLLNAITTTVTLRFTVMEVFHPDAALYLLQPAHFQIFSSLTTLRLICGRMQNPVDTLSSLHKLEIFEAHHLFLPIYPPGVDLPLTQTLRVLYLKSVSVQWMEGRIFPALKECSIIFPHHADAIQSVHMPSCSALKYDSNHLGTLEKFHIPPLDRLEINCSQWRTREGDLQLIRLHPTFAAQSLTCLHLEIKCSERLLAYMLRLVPALEELWMRLSSPRALSTAFFLALAAGGHKANAGPSSQTIIPLGRKLRRLHLIYERWLRGPERMALIPAFGAVVASHKPEDIFIFRLSLDEGSKLREWFISAPAERFEQSGKITIGVPSPDGIVHLENADQQEFRGIDEPLTESECIQLPKETEYIAADEFSAVSNVFLFSFHNLKEVRVPYLDLRMKRDPQFSLNAPLFHTLKALEVRTISPSFFAGQIFHKLERYGARGINIDERDITGQGPLTEMPVCTRLIVPLRRLATLKLPQIRELGLSIDAEHGHIWEKRISVNANLSGLRLLHLQFVHPTWPTVAVIKILGSLPALETLITNIQNHIASHVNLLEAFVPMNARGPSALNQSSWKGQISGVLCPKLENLQIEGTSLTFQARLMPVLKDIVNLRAIIGSPLKSVTLCFGEWHQRPPRKWQLIGRNKSFMMEEVVPAHWFVLDI